jgi:hypothetical protein
MHALTAPIMVAAAHTTGDKKVLNDTTVSPGWLGFGVVIALGLVCWILFRSMNRHLKKVPPSFDEPNSTPPSPSSGEQPQPPQTA